MLLLGPRQIAPSISHLAELLRFFNERRPVVLGHALLLWIDEPVSLLEQDHIVELLPEGNAKTHELPQVHGSWRWLLDPPIHVSRDISALLLVGTLLVA